MLYLYKGQAAIAPIATLGEIENNLGIVQGFASQLATFQANRKGEIDAAKKRSLDEKLSPEERQTAAAEALRLEGLWGNGSPASVLITSVSAAVSGNAMGSLQSMALQGAVTFLASYTAQEIKGFADGFKNPDGTESKLYSFTS